MADIETTVSPAPDFRIASGLKIISAANGVVYDNPLSISGAVSTINFANRSVIRYTVTGDLTGAFTWPPINFPELEADNQYVVLTIVFFQDATGNRAIDLDALFAGAGVENIFGIPMVDDSPGGETQVDIIARRAAGVTTYTVLFAPTLDASQIVGGVLTTDVLPTATGVAPGVVTLATGSGAAASGNHTHLTPIANRIVIHANGAAVPSNDYELLDMPTSGQIIRLTGVRLEGTGSPTATVSLKISGTPVTGTGLTANSTINSSDANASGANTFVARQVAQLAFTVTAGTVTMVSGYMHSALNTEPWAG